MKTLVNEKKLVKKLNKQSIIYKPQKEFITYKKDLSELNGVIFEIKNLKAIIISTDTVAGIISLNKSLIYQIKKRNKNKKLIKFVSNINQIPNVNETFKKLANKF